MEQNFLEQHRGKTKYLLLPFLFLAIIGLFAYCYKTNFFIYNSSLINEVAALLVPIIALLSVYIAFQQAQTSAAQKKIANNKLRLELFDRRLAIYDATKTLIRKINAGSITIKMILAYTDVVRDAKWFLNDQIHLYLNETIYNAAARLQEIDEELRENTNTAERAQLVKTRRKLRDWVSQQDSIIENRFSRYLKFRLQK